MIQFIHIDAVELRCVKSFDSIEACDYKSL